MSSDAETVRKSVKIYLGVFISLTVLTVVTVLVSYLDLGVGSAIFLALIIATAKGSLVALFFMHLKNEEKLIYGALILTAVFFLALMFLPLSWYLDSTGI